MKRDFHTDRTIIRSKEHKHGKVIGNLQHRISKIYCCIVNSSSFACTYISKKKNNPRFPIQKTNKQHIFSPVIISYAMLCYAMLFLFLSLHPLPRHMPIRVPLQLCTAPPDPPDLLLHQSNPKYLPQDPHSLFLPLTDSHHSRLSP